MPVLLFMLLLLVFSPLTVAALLGGLYLLFQSDLLRFLMWFVPLGVFLFIGALMLFGMSGANATPKAGAEDLRFKHDKLCPQCGSKNMRAQTICSTCRAPLPSH